MVISLPGRPYRARTNCAILEECSLGCWSTGQRAARHPVNDQCGFNESLFFMLNEFLVVYF